MPSPVELIKERLNIAEVIGSYIKLEKAGAGLKAKCPFHNERTPSFFVSADRGTYYCFGCGAKGDVFSFIQAFEGLDFMGALRTLALRAGVELVREDPKSKNERERLFLLLETATLFFERSLLGNDAAKKYLKNRGLDEKTMREWRVGFAPDEWHACMEYCKRAGFTDLELERAGIIKRESSKSYDRFRSRIIFPISDSAGRVVAFSGRILGKESDKIPKYLNSPETPVFSKSRVLYGLDRAKLEIRRIGYSILVEGQMDLLMCHQGGFKNTVASSGTAFTVEQAKLLKRLSHKILMVHDADKAGVQASLRAAVLALSLGMEVKVAALPKDTDPAELIRTEIDTWRNCLKSSRHVIDFYLDAIISEKLDSRAFMRALRDRLLPYVAALESSIERDHFVSHIARRASVREESIRDDLKKIPVQNKDAVVQKYEVVAPLTSRRHLAERLLMGLMFSEEQSSKKFFNVSVVKRELERILGKKRSENLLAQACEMKDELQYQADVYYEKSEAHADEVKELLATIEEDTLKEELALSMKELSAAEHEKDSSKIKKALARCQEVTARLHELKKG